MANILETAQTILQPIAREDLTRYERFERLGVVLFDGIAAFGWRVDMGDCGALGFPSTPDVLIRFLEKEKQHVPWLLQQAYTWRDEDIDGTLDPQFLLTCAPSQLWSDIGCGIAQFGYMSGSIGHGVELLRRRPNAIARRARLVCMGTIFQLAKGLPLYPALVRARGVLSVEFVSSFSMCEERDRVLGIRPIAP